MRLSLLQLNSNSDNYWERLIKYLTSHDFDVIQLQEVTGNDTVCGNIDSHRDTFDELQLHLQGKYEGELCIIQRYTSSPKSYCGVATFYKTSFSLVKKNEITLFHETDFYPSDAKSFEGVGRKLLHLTLEKDGKVISFLNTHFAWGPKPIEQPYQTEQGDKLIEYMKTVASPFVFSGDLNLTANQPTIQKLGKLASNLIEKNNITNTLNPRMHRVKELFPKGLAVDYIFTTPDIKVNKFSVLEEDLSDHFGLTAELEV
jgi:endonuclease/exonuclease/phosphatase family metal-dependent hydrolase